MSGRVWGAVAVGVGLILPLVGLLGWGTAHRDVGGWRPLPKLSPEAREAHPSFLRACTDSAGCEPPLACFWNRRQERQVCLDSDCVTDGDCPGETVCRWMPVEDGTKRAISFCTFVGVKGEGDPCLRLSRREEGACERDLVCADWCARRCGPWPFDACPEGFFCAEDEPNGAVCLPTCEGRVCPEGQACVREARAGVSVCARVHGPNCQRESCAEGLTCQVDTTPVRPGEAWMECVTPCKGEGYTQVGCSDFRTCLFGTCHEMCDPFQAHPCGPDFECVPMGGESGACAWAPEPPDPMRGQ